LKTMVDLAHRYGIALAVRGRDLAELAVLAEKAIKLGHKQLLLGSGAREPAQVLADQTQIRRLAIKKRFRPFGFPTVCLAAGEDAVLAAAVYVAKYAGVVLIDTTDPAEILPLITWRLNVYTDPQKPIAIEAKVYEVWKPRAGGPGVFNDQLFACLFLCNGRYRVRTGTGFYSAGGHGRYLGADGLGGGQADPRENRRLLGNLGDRGAR
jgi:acetyl-CoA decarbonylase/synthase complex subunit gamma